jgi:hypothetical protein
MKLLATALFTGMLAFGTAACAKEEPKKPAATAPAAATPAPAAPADAKKDDAPKTKQVCKDVVGKDGKAVKNKDGSVRQSCKTIKIHKKYDGTPVPEKAPKK